MSGKTFLWLKLHQGSCKLVENIRARIEIKINKWFIRILHSLILLPHNFVTTQYWFLLDISCKEGVSRSDVLRLAQLPWIPPKSVLEIRDLFNFHKPLPLFNWFSFGIFKKNSGESLVKRVLKMSSFFHSSLKILGDNVIFL